MFKNSTSSRKVTAAVLLFVALLSSVAIAATVAELLAKSEELWLQHGYKESNAAIDEALKMNPTNEQKAELYWRRARNQFEMAEQLPQDDKKRRLRKYRQIQDLSRKCISANKKLGECYLWLAIGMNRETTQRGILNSLWQTSAIEKYLKKAIALKPTYRSPNGSANSLGDAYYFLGQFYRLVPDWKAVLILYRTRGDKQKSVEMLRKAVELEPGRIEYVKELGVSLVCLGKSSKNPKVVDEGVQWLKKTEGMTMLKPTDEIDKKHAKRIMSNLDLACGYSRDAQQDVSEETFKKKKGK